MAAFWNQLKDKIFGKRLQFAVGYQLPGEMNRYDMVDLIGQYRKYVSEDGTGVELLRRLLLEPRLQS